MNSSSEDAGPIWGHVSRAARRLTPLLSCVFFVVLAGVPVSAAGFAVIAPAFGLMTVYYWSLHRPDLLPAPAVFAVGLFLDAVSGAPLGLNALVLLLVHGVVHSQRRFFHGKSFLVLWWGLMMIATGAAVVSWVLYSILFTARVDPLAVMFQLSVSLALYPALSWVLAVIQRRGVGAA